MQLLRKGSSLQKGRTGLSALVTGAGILLLIPIVAASYLEIRTAFWDFKVKQLCRTEGGVVIHKKIDVPKKQYERLRAAGRSTVISKNLYQPGDLAYADGTETVIHGSEPTVMRREAVIRSVRDNAIIGKYVMFSRVGGDLMSFFHPTYFSCPSPAQLSVEFQNIFEIKEARE